MLTQEMNDRLTRVGKPDVEAVLSGDGARLPEWL